MTFPILQASAAIQTNLKMCSYTYYPLGSQTLKGYLIGNHYPYLMMKKKNGSISSKKLLIMFKKLKKKKCSGDVADLCVFCTEKVRFPIFEGQHIFAIWQCMQKRNKQNLFRSLPGGNRDKWTLHFWNFCLELSPIIHKLPIYELLTIFNDIGMCFFRFIVFAAKVFPFLLLPLSPVKKKKKKMRILLV